MNARLCQRPERISGRTVSNSPCFSLETRNPGMVNIGVHGKGLWGEMFLFPFFPFRLKKENVSNLLATSLSAWIFLRDVNRKQKSAKCVIKSAGLLRQGPGDGARVTGPPGPGALGCTGCRPRPAEQKRLSSSVFLFLSCL